jgi:Zn-dependent M16 (insulinase) family peptidase
MEESFLAALQQMAALLFNRHNLLLAVTADGKEIDRFSSLGRVIPEAMSAVPVSPAELPPLNFPAHEAFITSAEVVFAVQGGALLPDGAGYNGQFEVLKTFLSRDYLWNTVRQMGGAYGCFIQFSQISGNIAFVSYRDPQVRKTYEAYAAIPDVVAGLDLPQSIMEQLIIGTYGSFNPLQSPASDDRENESAASTGSSNGSAWPRLSRPPRLTCGLSRRFLPPCSPQATVPSSATGRRSRTTRIFLIH